MTDIEVLRDAVIQAARAYVRGDGESYQLARDWEPLVDALDALDKAMRPDPWELLDEPPIWPAFITDWEKRVNDALAWREANTDA
jgi:hypothetical protein